MDRREFIKTTGTVIAGATLASETLTANAAKGAPANAEGRLLFPINRNWRFSPKPLDGGHEFTFDDSKLDRVVIPHTNVRLSWHNFDDKAYEFISLYRRKFKLPAEAKGKHVFVDFEGAMTASAVWVNGKRLGEYKGGYTPFSFDLTPHVNFDSENILAVDLDSTERIDIPPFGYQIDYLTFGGIHREVWLRVVPGSFIENIFAKPKDVLSGKPTLDVDVHIQHLESSRDAHAIEVDVREGDRSIAKATGKVPASGAAEEPTVHTVHFDALPNIKLWDLDHPNLYTVHVRLLNSARVVDADHRRIGFRLAEFTDRGFALNGKVSKLRGLDRHQTFPFVGQAMPGRCQRSDAYILKHKLKTNIVRTSHYPQSRHFLDACDEIGLLVLEEIPGWQHIGDENWKLISIDNVGRMIRRDWNHPCIILWGVRINESKDDHDFYTRTNALAHKLDPTRQTGGIRYFQSSEFLEDVFTMNDFDFPLKKPNHPRYLNTEFVGHTYPTKTIDQKERVTEHMLRHARIHNQLASDPQYAGGIGWCAFDYNTHADFGSSDRICYHGVTDIFREPKAAAHFYKSQCDPSDEVVLEPAFSWARGDESIGFRQAWFCSNCDHLKVYIDGKQVAEVDPNKTEFQYLKYPPFVVDLYDAAIAHWGDLKVEGYIGGKKAIEKTLSGRGVDQKFAIIPDDAKLQADGADTTRVVLRVTDEFGAPRPFSGDAIKLDLQGPAEIIGDNPFALVGGTGAIWVRAKEQPGTVTLTATHPWLGKQSVSFEITAAASETV